MALPDNYDIKQYLPTEQDFADVFAAKQTGNYYKLPYYPLSKDEPYCYPTIRIYLAAILLKWEELGKQIENNLLAGKYEYINGTKQLIPYYTPKDLAIIRSFAVQYKQYYIGGYMKYKDAGQGLESPDKLTQQARDARKGEIEVKIKNSSSVLRIIPYSMKYGKDDPNKRQAGAKMHIFFGKDLGGKYNIVIRGSNLYGCNEHPTYDQPYFLTEQEARDFIANFNHNNINTKVTIEDWRFVITDRPMDDGYERDANGSYLIDAKGNYVRAYYMPSQTELTKVDTVCGIAYMLKEDRDAYWDKIYKERAERKAKK